MLVLYMLEGLRDLVLAEGEPVLALKDLVLAEGDPVLALKDLVLPEGESNDTNSANGWVAVGSEGSESAVEGTTGFSRKLLL